MYFKLKLTKNLNNIEHYMRLSQFRKTFRIFFLLLSICFFLQKSAFANIDTIYAGIPEGQFGVSCLDLSNFSGTIQSINNICPAQSNGNSSFIIQSGNTGCINYFGINEGPSTACIEICDDTPDCDTIYLLLNISPTIPLFSTCDSLIIPDVLNINWSDCDADAKVCLPIRFDQLADIDIYDNGVLYNNGITGCNVDTIVAYSYFALFGQGATGPYMLDSWSINGDEYNGEFADINALLDSMNVWDTLGVWVFDTTTNFTIRGGFSDNYYSSIIASKPGIINSTSIMGANYGLTPLGSELTLVQGQHLIELVDNINACTDTVMVNIVCMPSKYLTVKTYVGLMDSICIDTSNLVGNFSSIENICADDAQNSEVQIDVFQNDNCIDWEALTKGNAQACLVSCDDLGFCDTTFVDFEILCLTPDTIEIMMDENSTETVCVDTMELFGSLTSFQIGCPNNGLTNITLDSVNYCVDIMSTALAGGDSLCVVLCDDAGGCDTTYIFATIGASDIIAESDYDSTAFNTPITIDVLVNDTFALLDSMYLLSQPENGLVTVDSNGMFVYTPNEGFCGQDIFTYEICDLNNCDMASVIITVGCEEIVVYNGMSPNGDGLNDTFRIDGLEGYPNHIVHVYNRWGNMIMEQSSYKSDWMGTWQNLRLPEGTYFYTIDLKDEAGTVKGGYLYLTH